MKTIKQAVYRVLNNTTGITKRALSYKGVASWWKKQKPANRSALIGSGIGVLGGGLLGAATGKDAFQGAVNGALVGGAFGGATGLGYGLLNEREALRNKMQIAKEQAARQKQKELQEMHQEVSKVTNPFQWFLNPKNPVYTGYAKKPLIYKQR